MKQEPALFEDDLEQDELDPYHLDPYDLDDLDDEKFWRRKRPSPRVKPKHSTPQDPDDPIPVGADPGLRTILALGYLDRVLGELKSGKEATVYLVEHRGVVLAAKVYRDLRARHFKNDHLYREGRTITDARLAKALAQRSHAGVAAQQGMWTAFEYAQLWELHHAGVNVPRPIIGPDPFDIEQAGPTVLMAFVGDGTIPAPRLDTVRLTPQEAESAVTQSLDIMARFLRLGKVHGDFSAYNLLWHQGRVVVIDFPQIVLTTDPHAREVLARDAHSFCLSFRRHGVRLEPHEVLREVKRRAASAGGNV